jgi:spermidine/putrescine transport system permease protein
MKNTAKRIYMIIILIFLYTPILTLIILSFNSSKSMAKWGGFTLSWYSSLFRDSVIMDSLYTTLLLALSAAIISTVLGTLACVAINRMKSRSRSVIMGVTNIPMVNAEIVTGIAFLLLFLGLGVTFSFYTVLIAHITFCIPYVVLSVMPKIRQIDNSTYEAALDLGASPLHAFFKVILPDLRSGILSGFLLAFTMSLDDFIVTHFTKGQGFDTLSTKIYTEVRKGIRPEIYALSTLMFVTVFVLLLLANRKPKQEQ